MQLVSSMTNKQLVRQIAAGNETAFNALYHATYRMVYLQAQKLLHDQDAAETVTQDVFVTVYRNIGKLENPEALRSWIGGVAVRLALKQRQKLAASRETDIESEQIMDILDDAAQAPTPESALCEAENGRIIAELVDQLPEQQRATVLLYYYDACAIRQIAEIMQCSEGTVKSRLNYARKAMQQLIEQKERKDNIRLHSFSPGLLLLSLGAKEQALQLSQSIWQNVIAKLSFGAAAGAGAGSAAAGTAAKTAAGAGTKVAAGAAGKAVSVKIAASVTAGALLIGGTGVAISFHRKAQVQPTVSLEQRVGELSEPEQRKLWRTAGYLQILEDNEGWLQYARLLDMDADGTEELLVSGMLDEEGSRERRETMLSGRVPVYAFRQTEAQTLTSHDFFPKAAYSSYFATLAICKDTDTNGYTVEYIAAPDTMYCYGTLDGWTQLRYDLAYSLGKPDDYARMHFFENGTDFQQDSIFASKYYILADTYRAYLDRMERVDYLYGYGFLFDSSPRPDYYHYFRFDTERLEDPQHSTPEQAVQTLLERGEAFGFNEEELHELAQKVAVEPDETGGADTEFFRIAPDSNTN